jgi:hypothetical protein
MLNNIVANVYAMAPNDRGIGLDENMQLNQLVIQITNILIIVGLAIVVVMLALGFVKYVTSQGEKTAVESAQKTLTYAVIGGVGLALVFVIRSLIVRFMGIDSSAYTAY